MKQTYIKPSTTVYQMQLRHNMLETSEVGVSSKNYSNGTILSRDGGDWDDED